MQDQNDSEPEAEWSAENRAPVGRKSVWPTLEQQARYIEVPHRPQSKDRPGYLGQSP